MKAMKIVAALAAFLCAVAVQAGAPPKVMFLPDQAWAKANGYTENIDRNGKTRVVIDYDRCFDDQDFVSVTIRLKKLMQNYGLPVVDFRQNSANDDMDEAFDAVYEDKQGNTTVRTSLDDLLARAQPDIIVNVGWNKNGSGFNYSISYRMDGVDAYSGKSQATVDGTSPKVASSQSVGDLVAATAEQQFADFCRRLSVYFDEIQDPTVGREVRLVISCKDGGVDMDSEFGGETLSSIIYNWLDANTVGGQFTEATSSPNRLVYDQVHIPLKENGRSLQAKQFSEKLAKYLKTNFGLRVENRSSGLGSGRLIISD